MPRRKEPAIPDAILDQLLAGGAASAAVDQGGLLDSLKKALTERALNAEMDYHLASDDGAANTRNGYGRKTVMTDTGKLAIDVPRARHSCKARTITTGAGEIAGIVPGEAAEAELLELSYMGELTDQRADTLRRGRQFAEKAARDIDGVALGDRGVAA